MENLVTVPAFSILKQPDDASCGPTCLHAVYRHYNDVVSLPRLINAVTQFPHGGTLAVFLANHALTRGYKTRIYTYNMEMFDPTWFDGESATLTERLHAQLKASRRGSRFKLATDGYLRYLRNGGELRMQDLTSALILSYLRRGIPIIAGLSSTYLYRTPRERNDRYDDLRGQSAGHFVVLYGFDQQRRPVLIADPYQPKAMRKQLTYEVTMSRLVCAILLGVLTYDANLLMIER